MMSLPSKQKVGNCLDSLVCIYAFVLERIGHNLIVTITLETSVARQKSKHDWIYIGLPGLTNPFSSHRDLCILKPKSIESW